MTASSGLPNEVLAQGTLPVSLDAGEVDAFASTLGLTASAIPSTYPMRLLAAPAIRDAVRQCIESRGLVAFHEGQTFDRIGAPLLVGEAGLTLAYSVVMEPGPPQRIAITGTLSGNDGERLRIVAQLRLIDPKSLGGAA